MFYGPLSLAFQLRGSSECKACQTLMMLFLYSLLILKSISKFCFFIYCTILFFLRVWTKIESSSVTIVVFWNYWSDIIFSGFSNIISWIEYYYPFLLLIEGNPPSEPLLDVLKSLSSFIMTFFLWYLSFFIIF